MVSPAKGTHNVNVIAHFSTGHVLGASAVGGLDANSLFDLLLIETHHI